MNSGHVLFPLCEALVEATQGAGYTDVLADAVDASWDLINPHNAMELALVIGRRLADDGRRSFASAVRLRLEDREDFESELATNSAGHCLRRVLENDYEAL